MKRRMNRFTALLKGVMMGWFIGGIAALVYAPRRGDETQAIIRSRGGELREQASEMAEATRTRVEEMTRSGAERLEEQRIAVESTLEGIREGLRTYSEQGHEGGDRPADIQPTDVTA